MLKGSHANSTIGLLFSATLDLLRPFYPPVDSLSMSEPSVQKWGKTAGPWASMAFLREDFIFFENFALHEGSEQLGKVGIAFSQAFRRIEQKLVAAQTYSAKEFSVTDTPTLINLIMEVQHPDFLSALQGSMLLARRAYIRAAIFAYFVRSCRHAVGSEASSGNVKGLEEYVVGLSPGSVDQHLEIKTSEAAMALQERANLLFGDELQLIAEFRRGHRCVTPFVLPFKCRSYLVFEGGAFGAALFDTERVASEMLPLAAQLPS